MQDKSYARVTAKIVWHEQKIEQIKVARDELQPIRFQGQMIDSETGLHYNRFRYFDPDVGMFISRDPIGLMGGNNVFQYAPNPTGWIDPSGLKPSFFPGKISQMPYKASELKPLVKHSKEWYAAIAAAKLSKSTCSRFQVRVESSTEAKIFLYEAFGNMDRRSAQTQLKRRKAGLGKYKKGYEQHMKPETGKQDLPHIKFYDGCNNGHIFYKKPN